MPFFIFVGKTWHSKEYKISIQNHNQSYSKFKSISTSEKLILFISVLLTTQLLIKFRNTDNRFFFIIILNVCKRKKMRLTAVVCKWITIKNFKFMDIMQKNLKRLNSCDENLHKQNNILSLSFIFFFFFWANFVICKCFLSIHFHGKSDLVTERNSILKGKVGSLTNDALIQFEPHGRNQPEFACQQKKTQWYNHQEVWR